MVAGNTLHSCSVGLQAAAPASAARRKVAKLPFVLGKVCPSICGASIPQEARSSGDEEGGDERSNHSEDAPEACDDACDESSASEATAPGHGGASASSAPASPPPTVAAAPSEVAKALGIDLCDYDRKPAVRSAKCFVCESNIPKGSDRWHLMPSRPRGRMYLVWKHVHASCVSRIPQKFREPSLRYLQGLAEDDVPAGLNLREAMGSLASPEAAPQAPPALPPDIVAPKRRRP